MDSVPPEHAAHNEPSDALTSAWAKYCTYNANAIYFQKIFLNLRQAILGIGVVATALAVFYTEHYQCENKDIDPMTLYRERPGIFVLWLLVIAAPILAGALTLGAKKLDRGNAWVLLRGAAEDLLSEIFFYRTRTGDYAPDREAGPTRHLARQTERIARHLAEAASFWPMPKRPSSLQEMSGDPSRTLDADAYIEHRIQDQLSFFRKKCGIFDRSTYRSHWAAILLGAMGALLAAVNLVYLVPVTLALSAAISSRTQLRDEDKVLLSYARTETRLENVLVWWSGVPRAERGTQRSLEDLVGRTGAILRRENASWLDTMRENLAQLQENSADTASAAG